MSSRGFDMHGYDVTHRLNLGLLYTIQLLRQIMIGFTVYFDFSLSRFKMIKSANLSLQCNTFNPAVYVNIIYFGS